MKYRLFDTRGSVRVRITHSGRLSLRRRGMEGLLENEVDGWSTWKLMDLWKVFGYRMFIPPMAPFEPIIELEVVEGTDS